VYLFLGIYWLQGGSGFPFGENDVRAQMMGSPFYNLTQSTGGAAIALIGLMGGVAGIAMVKLWWRKTSVVWITFAWMMCALLILVIPDTRIVQNFAYLFVLHFGFIDWPVINQVLCIIGGFLWGATAVTYHRRTRGACLNCGRVNNLRGDVRRGTTAPSAVRWGQLAVVVAVLSPLPYGIVRWALAFGIPLGFSEAASSLEERAIVFILGGMHIGGAILTLGLIRRWGEIFPRWCLFLSGKRIPVWLAVIPATFAATIITIAGVKTTIQLISGLVDGSIIINAHNWGELGPIFFLLPWGISLGFATYFYYLRRRETCRHCGADGCS
jgi:hypothetical protein